MPLERWQPGANYSFHLASRAACNSDLLKQPLNRQLCANVLKTARVCVCVCVRLPRRYWCWLAQIALIALSP